MFTKSQFGLVTLSILSASQSVVGRERWLERDNRAVHLDPRRFGQEHPAVIDKLSNACSGGVCATLAGAAITPLLAAQPECSQQDMADQIIDAAAQFDDATKALIISLAVEYRQAEKNTPPDFTTNPPTNRNSVFCQKAPKNAQLNGLVQAQDPANDPDIFFDPATKASVKKGSQANTAPFTGSGAAAPAASAVDTTAAAATTAVAIATAAEIAATDPCPATVTVTAAAASSTDAAGATGDAGAIGNFGSCTVPQIQFGVGFDNRKETSFEPVDLKSFNHGSAQNIDIITKFICDTLTNSCGADQTAKDTCAKAITAADTGAPKTGVQADLFNAVFGITTNFAAVASVDDQGNVVAGTGSGAAAATTAAAAATSAADDAAATGSASAIGDFGSCTVPQIQFAVGFDNRKETSFEPVDLKSFNHGSAQNIDIITKFICDTLTNSCGADQTAKDTCAKAITAADTGAPKTGVQADLFNAVFGITTNFAAVAAVDDQGNVVAGTGSGAAATPAAAATATAAAAASAPQAAAVAGNLQTFTGALGGVTPPAVTDLGNGQFQVDGNAAFNNEQNALIRSCDVQHNQCANAANASGNKGDLTVDACGVQQTACNNAASQA
ncbi:hypothetical protein C8J56DRAFT_1045574 [Mycena floridula]|nr:hypothetical protein C8J56DRAFT_1045574 [Mycena floridula]